MSPPCSEAWAGFAVVPSQGKRVCVISLAKKTTNRKVLWPWRSTLAFWTPKCDYIETTPLPTSSAVFQVRMPAAGDRVGDCVDFTHVWLQRGHGLANAYCFLSERNEKGHSKALEAANGEVEASSVYTVSFSSGSRRSVLFRRVLHRSLELTVQWG